jgi:hypothetical protein
MKLKPKTKRPFVRDSYGGGELGEQRAHKALTLHEGRLRPGTRVRLTRGREKGLVGVVAPGDAFGRSVYVDTVDGMRWQVETRDLEVLSMPRFATAGRTSRIATKNMPSARMVSALRPDGVTVYRLVTDGSDRLLRGKNGALHFPTQSAARAAARHHGFRISAMPESGRPSRIATKSKCPSCGHKAHGPGGCMAFAKNKFCRC